MKREIFQQTQCREVFAKLFSKSGERSKREEDRAMIYIYLAQGFEETEMTVPLDMCRRAGLEVKTVSVAGDEYVTGSHGITIKADMKASDSEYSPENAEMVILPGGMPGTKNLEKSEAVKSALDTVSRRGKYIAAICAAPSVLGKLGYLKGKRATCYPGFEEYLYGAEATGEQSTVDGKIITGRGAGAALDFAYAIIGELCGKERAEKIKNEIMAK